jgi:hypothetical protein
MSTPTKQVTLAQIDALAVSSNSPMTQQTICLDMAKALRKLGEGERAALAEKLASEFESRAHAQWGKSYIDSAGKSFTDGWANRLASGDMTVLDELGVPRTPQLEAAIRGSGPSNPAQGSGRRPGILARLLGG